ncbi:MAG: ABC transporter ATP-binding protein [Chloroflexi bacterium]|nr:ABC transporter ATP-binding protein [Chloroflexota bacterium]
MKLEIGYLTKSYTTKTGPLTALESIQLQLNAGEFVCLLGPSGCGKSTLLNIVAGLDEPTAGQVRIDGRVVRGPGTDRVMIFQNAALFPWLNVIDNTEFGLQMAGVPRPARRQIARRFLQMVHLTEFEQAFVHELSGGMRQRVAIARALALDPDVLLMDEPFGALDAQSRDILHSELQEIWSSTHKTVLFVTHNVREAIVLGDRVVVLSSRPGRIKRVFPIDLPRPREIESYAVVDLAREIMEVLRDDVLVSERAAQLALLGREGEAKIEAGLRASFREVGDDVL